MSTPDRKDDLYIHDLADAMWRKSPLSASNSDCVEITDLPGGAVAVRDSKNPHRPELRFTATEWAAFTGGLTQGLI